MTRRRNTVGWMHWGEGEDREHSMNTQPPPTYKDGYCVDGVGYMNILKTTGLLEASTPEQPDPGLGTMCTAYKKNHPEAPMTVCLTKSNPYGFAWKPAYVFKRDGDGTMKPQLAEYCDADKRCKVKLLPCGVILPAPLTRIFPDMHRACGSMKYPSAIQSARSYIEQLQQENGGFYADVVAWLDWHIASCIPWPFGNGVPREKALTYKYLPGNFSAPGIAIQAIEDRTPDFENAEAWATRIKNLPGQLAGALGPNHNLSSGAMRAVYSLVWHIYHGTLHPGWIGILQDSKSSSNDVAYQLYGAMDVMPHPQGPWEAHARLRLSQRVGDTVELIQGAPEEVNKCLVVLLRRYLNREPWTPEASEERLAQHHSELHIIHKGFYTCRHPHDISFYPVEDCHVIWGQELHIITILRLLLHMCITGPTRPPSLPEPLTRVFRGMYMDATKLGYPQAMAFAKLHMDKSPVYSRVVKWLDWCIYQCVPWPFEESSAIYKFKEERFDRFKGGYLFGVGGGLPIETPYQPESPAEMQSSIGSLLEAIREEAILTPAERSTAMLAVYSLLWHLYRGTLHPRWIAIATPTAPEAEMGWYFYTCLGHIRCLENGILTDTKAITLDESEMESSIQNQSRLPREKVRGTGWLKHARHILSPYPNGSITHVLKRPMRIRVVNRALFILLRRYITNQPWEPDESAYAEHHRDLFTIHAALSYRYSPDEELHTRERYTFLYWLLYKCMLQPWEL